VILREARKLYEDQHGHRHPALCVRDTCLKLEVTGWYEIKERLYESQQTSFDVDLAMFDRAIAAAESRAGK